MNQGFFLESEGQFYVDSIEFLKAINGKCASEFCVTESDLRKIEEYYYYDFIGYEKNPDAKIELPNVQDRYYQLYRNIETTWFSYIPQKIELDLTHKCNFMCKHCGRNSSPSREDGKMSLQGYVDFLALAGSIGVSGLSLMGGEPTCHPELIELAIIAKLSGIRDIFTSTNGWLINKSLAKKMADVFGSVQVSLHGALPTTHDRIVGLHGAFDKAIHAIMLFKENNVQSVNISFTVMKENVREMTSMVEIAKNLGVSYIRFLILSPQGRGGNLDQWSKVDIQTITQTIKQLHDDNFDKVGVQAGGFLPFSEIRSDATFYGCPAGRTLLYLSADGIFRPCEAVGLDLGEYSKTDLMDIWHSQSMVDLRKRPSCDCLYNGICAGGCLGNEHWNQMFLNRKGGDDTHEKGGTTNKGNAF
jgi:radical SAM protein with 4Fe4S-binding SPASM domain